MNTYCRYCGEAIELVEGVGWVDARSGDDGGTYDICQSARAHRPAEKGNA